MILRLKKGRKTYDYTYSHSVTTHYDDRTEIELVDTNGKEPYKVVNLPEDGSIAFICNNDGHTVNVERWPRKMKDAGFKAMV